ncbi:MAG TPA: DUF6152 family protein [Terriglobia bacterium]|nr:DUF6152 family protein [Terriglobia bacterium]
MKSRLFVLMIMATLAFCVTAYAHHSFAGSYIEDKSVTIEGKVVQFDIRNPHSFINIEVVGKDGKTARWGGEWGGVTQLSEGGVTKFTLKVGDKVVIDGAPSRDVDEHKVLIRKVVKPATANSPEFSWGGTVR